VYFSPATASKPLSAKGLPAPSIQSKALVEMSHGPLIPSVVSSVHPVT